MLEATSIEATEAGVPPAVREWVLSLFRAGDANDLETVLSYYAPDVIFRFGNGEPFHGREAMRQSLQDRRNRASKIEHELVGIWTGEDGEYSVVSAECNVSYTVPGKGRITVPCTSTMRRDGGGLIADYRVFIDVAPAFG